MDRTTIEWTDATWNPTRGCSCVSPGCKNCYAMKVAARFSGPGLAYEGLAFMHPKAGGQWTGTLRLISESLDAPLRWRRPRRIFVNSMSDLFHEKLPLGVIAEVFAVMYLAPRHTFQVLTKRSDVMRDVLNDPRFYEEMLKAGDRIRASRPRLFETAPSIRHPKSDPAPWVMLGVSVENQKTADTRIEHLRETPAVWRFVSGEPLLERTNMRLRPRSPWHARPPSTWAELAWPDWAPAELRLQIESFWSHHGGPKAWLRAMDGDGSGVSWLRYPAFGERGEYSLTGPGERPVVGRYVHAWNNIGRVVTDAGAVEVVSGASRAPDVDWVIVGGESGTGARPFDVAWAYDLQEQCAAAGAAFFMKQLGSAPVATPVAGYTTGIPKKSKKGGALSDLPEDLRVRQFPEVRRG